MSVFRTNWVGAILFAGIALLGAVGCQQTSRSVRVGPDDFIVYRSTAGLISAMPSDTSGGGPAAGTEFRVEGNGHVRFARSAGDATSVGEAWLSPRETAELFRWVVEQGVFSLPREPGIYPEPLHTAGMLSPSCGIECRVGPQNCRAYCPESQVPDRAEAIVSRLQSLMKDVEASARGPKPGPGPDAVVTQAKAAKG